MVHVHPGTVMQPGKCLKTAKGSHYNNKKTGGAVNAKQFDQVRIQMFVIVRVRSARLINIIIDLQSTGHRKGKEKINGKGGQNGSPSF